MRRPARGLHTLKEIAEKAGVSIVAASVALNPSTHSRAKVSETTRKKILRIAERFNYKPNAFARSLRQKRIGRIGFAADRYNDLANNELKHRVLRASIERGTPLHFLNYDQYSTASFMVQDMLSFDLEKIILFRFWDRMNAAERKALTSRFGDRLLVIDLADNNASRGVSFLYADLNSAWHALFDHLIPRYAHIAVITYAVPISAPGAAVFVPPQNAVFEALTVKFGSDRFDNTRDVYRIDITDADTVYRTARRIVASGYDCIKVHHDQIAPMVYKAVIDSGKRIGDIGIAGTDDLYFSQYLSPPLTTIKNDFDAYTAGIFSWLDAPVQKTLISAPLIIRESTSRS